VREARQVLLNQPRIRFVEKGNAPGDDVYVAFGRLLVGVTLPSASFINLVQRQRSLSVHAIWRQRSVDDMAENRLSSIPQADSLEKMGEFWDTHDFTQFDTDAPDVAFSISTTVSIEPDLLAAVEKQARLRGIAVETLVNLWLQEKLSEQVPLVPPAT
jgi:hypothetical protein